MVFFFEVVVGWVFGVITDAVIDYDEATKPDCIR